MDKKRRLKGKRESNENMNNKQTNKKKTICEGKRRR